MIAGAVSETSTTNVPVSISYSRSKPRSFTRSAGAATDTELVEYEIRQEIVHEICDRLANSIAERHLRRRRSQVRRCAGEKL